MLRRLPFYPLLFALFPVLSLAAHNIQEISVDLVYRPLLISFLVGLVVFILMQVLLRDWPRAGLITLIFLLFFFTYGQVYDKLKSLSPFTLSLFRHRTLLPAYGILAAGLMWLVWKKLKQPAAWTFGLNIFSIYLLIYPLFVISSNIVQQWSADAALKTSTLRPVSGAEKPDVYYIILDAYGRQDVLRDTLHYDNSPFLDALRERGF